MITLKSLKSSYIIVLLIIVGITSISGTYKAKPILESSDIPGFYLGLQRGNSEDVLELAEAKPEYRVIKNTKRYRHFCETWYTKPEKEIWETQTDYERRGTLKYSALHVTRYYLDTKSDALEWAKIEMEGNDLIPSTAKGTYQRWTEGGYSVPLIGNKCWSDKNSYWVKEEHRGLEIIFVKDNIVVRVRGGGDDPNMPVTPLFVQKIAQLVESRL